MELIPEVNENLVFLIKVPTTLISVYTLLHHFDRQAINLLY
jgi:hypothetical protein